MFMSVEIVLTSEEDCFKQLSFFTKFIKKNIKLIDDFIDEILLQMQNLFV